MDPARLYALDIETDTSVDGLDAEVAPVIAVGLAYQGRSITFDGPESELLRSLDDHLGSLPPGLIITWNGSRFDLPFLDARARHCGTPVALRLVPVRRHVHTAHAEPRWDARWYDHRHLDLYDLYRNDVGAGLGISCGLKRMARLAGLDPVEVDFERFHELDRTEVARYVRSDAEVTRVLALRRWPSVRRAADLPFPPSPVEPTPP
ncbi:MAG: 3'-5' exonuclease [Microthrixaceae bacterium]